MPGQQYTYKNGRLITHGPGAGTPDACSPAVTATGQGLISEDTHSYWDVDTFDPNGLKYFGKTGLTWHEYHRTWTPDNRNNCSRNPPGDFVSVEVFGNPNATIEGTYSGEGLWDVPPHQSPDIMVCIDGNCLPPCQDSFLCFWSNLRLPGGSVKIVVLDKDFLKDDLIGRGVCSANRTCRIGQAEVVLGKE